MRPFRYHKAFSTTTEPSQRTKCTPHSQATFRGGLDWTREDVKSKASHHNVKREATRRFSVQAAAAVAVPESPAHDSTEIGTWRHLHFCPSDALEAPKGSTEPHQDTYLREIYIRDFALVREQRLAFQPGLNVISGESGSGKSVLVSALGQLIGQPVPENCIRSPAKTAVVEGKLHLAPQALDSARRFFAAQNILQKVFPASAATGAEILIRREIVAGEQPKRLRSRSSLNNVVVSQRLLRDFGAMFMDINGQLAAQSLSLKTKISRDPESQISLLDNLAGTTHLATSFGRQFSDLRQISAELEALDELGDESAREQLEEMIERIGSVKVVAGEERDLKVRIREMDSRKENVENCMTARMSLVGDGSAGGAEELISVVHSSLKAILSREQSMSRLKCGNPDGGVEDSEEGSGEQFMTSALRSLDRARLHLSSAEDQIRSYAEDFQFSEQEYARLKERYNKLNRLMREFRCGTTEQLLDVAEKASADLERWHNSQGSREEKERGVERMQLQLALEGSQLSRQRREAAGKLRVAVEAGLADLAMSGSRFDIRIGWEKASQGEEGVFVPEACAHEAFEEGDKSYKANINGFDSVEYLLAAGPAEPLRPLSTVASGGERSRIMLALKGAPLSYGASPEETLEESPYPQLSSSVLVLDELDSGVGGRLGAPVGRLLRKMASSCKAGSSQIMCITHLPQVAAHAAHHICVRKQPSETGRTVTSFVPLGGVEERSREIAAMGGVRIEEAFVIMEAAALQ